MSLPDLSLASWRPTRDALRSYAEVVSGIRKATAPREKHWWHISLRVTATGLTTTPIVAGDRVVELSLSLVDHRLYVATNRGQHTEIELHGQSASAFCDQTLAALADLDIRLEIDRARFAATEPQTYDQAAVSRYWQVLPLVDGVLRHLKSEHRGESGAAQFWPHHFDVALLLFTGRRVPGVDPADEESADESMNFGFLPGDEGIAEPYFYATAYPTPVGLADSPLPRGAYWHTAGWTGAVLPYPELRTPAELWDGSLEFFRAARDAGFARMK